VGGLGEDAAEGSAMRSRPRIRGLRMGCGRRGRAVRRWRVAVGGGGFELYVAVFVAGAVDSADEDSVGDGVGALGGLPGVVLGGAELFLSRVPADGGGEEEDLGPAEAVRRAPSGYHWSQQTKVPIFPAEWKCF